MAKMGYRRLACLCFICCGLFLCVGCPSAPPVVPDNSGAVADTQADLAADVANINAGASTIETQAQDIAAEIGATDNARLSALITRHVADAIKHKRDAAKLEQSFMAAKQEVIQTLKDKAILSGALQKETTAHLETRNQRNIWLGLFVFLAAGVAVGIYLKLRF